jgi:hypothetical protein
MFALPVVFNNEKNVPLSGLIVFFLFDARDPPENPTPASEG